MSHAFGFRRPFVRRLVQAGLCLSLAAASACGEDTTQSKGELDASADPADAESKDDAGVEHVPVVLPERVAIVADWLAGSLSFTKFDVLADKGSKAEALITTLDLSKYSPGPLALELTPDGKKLLVAVSSGFFGIPGAGLLLLNQADIPAGAGSVLVIDVATQKVEAELLTGDVPNGLAITPDGKRAFVTHFNSGDMTIIDLTKNEIVSTFAVGIYAEEVALDETGTVGIVGYSEAGNVRTFAVADPEGTLSEPLILPDDSAGVAFFPGTKIALAVQAPSPITYVLQGAAAGYALIDVNDPAKPVVLDNYRVKEMLGVYPAQPAPNRGTVIVPTVTGDDVFSVREYEVEGGKVKLKQSIDVGESFFLGALGFAYDGKDSVVLAVPGKRSLIVTNLETQETHTIDWEQTEAGPSDVVYR